MKYGLSNFKLVSVKFILKWEKDWTRLFILYLTDVPSVLTILADNVR
jgi:hypothetical protein